MSANRHHPTADIETHDGRWNHEVYVFSVKTPRGRKRYECVFCGEDIPKGVRHVAFTTIGQEGPGWECWRLHGECYQSGEAMFDNNGRPDWRWNPDGDQ